MYKYTVYTEDCGNIPKFFEPWFDSFTVIPTVGYWKGAKEKSVKVEVYDTPNNSALVPIIIICDCIKKANNQEAVGYTQEKLEFNLV